MTIPIVITTAGLQPQSPATLRAKLLAGVAATNPGYTPNLPGSLIEDISSTDVGALVVSDSALVELVNSLTPFGANAFLLTQLGNVYGVPLGVGSNTSVFVVFFGPPSFVIAEGFTVTDGTYQYTVQDGGIIGSDGSSLPLFALAAQSGSWPIAPGTVTGLVTSVPSGLSPPLTVSNPQAGTPGAAAQSEEDYRAQVLQAGLASSQGMPRYLRTILGNVPGVQKRLISSLLQSGGGWEIVVGGGDPIQVAYAIFKALFDISTLVGSTIKVASATNANPVVYETTLNHGLANGQTGVVVSGSNPSGFNHTGTATVVDEKHFSLPFDTTSSGTYVGDGVVTPNARNIVANVNDYPNVYSVPFVNPPEQTVTMTVTWNTTSPFSVSPSVIAALASQPLVDYVNSVPVGAPLNVLTMESVFRDAISGTLPPELLTRIVFAVSINGVLTAVTSGTVIIEGDPESYFFTQSTDITVTQG